MDISAPGIGSAGIRDLPVKDTVCRIGIVAWMREPAVPISLLLKEGRELYQTGRLSDAEAVYEQILDTDPRHFEARHFLGVIHYKQGNYARALHHVDLALAINSQVSATYCARAITLLALKRYDEAVTSLDRAITLNPDDAGALGNRGIALKELGRTAEAVASYDRAIALNPSFAGAFTARGVALRELGRFEEALASFNQAIILEPDSAEALINRAAAVSPNTLWCFHLRHGAAAIRPPPWLREKGK